MTTRQREWRTSKQTCTYAGHAFTIELDENDLKNEATIAGTPFFECLSLCVCVSVLLML